MVRLILREPNIFSGVRIEVHVTSHVTPDSSRSTHLVISNVGGKFLINSLCLLERAIQTIYMVF